MPIRRELRTYYAGARWRAVRRVVLQRAQWCCEDCGLIGGAQYWRRGRLVDVQLGVSHVDHDDLARFYDPVNLRARCRRCHLAADMGQHRNTRADRKDRGRPLLVL